MVPIVAYAQIADEVSVRGKRMETGSTAIGNAEARELPGAFGDTLRAVEALPGVTPVVSGLPFFYVRGAPPNNTAFFLDGIRVPLLFHVGLAESVIHPGLIERVDFLPGAAPAEYGGVAGAIVTGELKAPRPELHGEANLRLVDAGALVESPFADGRGTALVAARYGYPGPIAGLFVKGLRLQYWDYQARASYDLTDEDRIGVFGFGSRDVFGRRRQGTYVEDLDSSEHRVDLRWDHAITDGHFLVATTLGYDHIGRSPTYLGDASLGVRAGVERGLAKSARLRAGVRFGVDDYDVDTTAVGVERPFSAYSRTNATSTIYSDVVWRLAPRVEIVPGARVDTFSGIPAFDPRLSARVTLSSHATWLTTAGLSHQYQALRVGTQDLPVQIVTEPGFVPGEKRKLQEVAQAGQGIALALPSDVTVTTTAFLSGWTNLTDVTLPCDDKSSPGNPSFVCPPNASVHGRAFGVETMLRRSLTKKLSGWLSATLSRSTREAHFLRKDGAFDVAEVPSEGDRLVVVNALATYDLGRRWRAGGRFVFYTGTPYSSSNGERSIPPYNDHRLPPFYRIDARIEKRWPLGASGSIAFVAEVQNLTLHKERYGLDCMANGPQPAPGSKTAAPTITCTPDDFGPLTLPSVGVEAFF